MNPERAKAWVRKNFRTIATLLIGVAVGAYVTYSSGLGQPTVTCHDHVVTTADTVALTWRNGWTETMDKRVFMQLVNDAGSLMGAGFIDPSIPGMNTAPTVTTRPGFDLYHESICNVEFAAQGAPHWGKLISGGKG